jgi:hypothetical protein
MNQREFTRVRTSIPVDCVCADGSPHSGSTKDVSLNGCFIPSDSPPAEGTTCTATLYIDGRDGVIRVGANAEVISHRQGGFALHFHELLELDSYEHLRNLVLYNAEDPNQAECEFDSHLGLKRIEPGQAPPR